MPLTWTLTIYVSAVLFAVTAWFSRRVPWLSSYLLACVPASIIWNLQLWDVSRYVRPVILMFQAMAVLESIALLHRNCWKPKHRYLFAGFCGLCAVGMGFTVVSYPGFPEGLWRVQFGLETVSAVAIAAALLLFRWFGNFKPDGWTIGNAGVMMLYCGLEAGALLFQCAPKRLLTLENWQAVDMTLALTQDYCLLWWILMHWQGLNEAVL